MKQNLSPLQSAETTVKEQSIDAMIPKKSVSIFLVVVLLIVLSGIFGILGYVLGRSSIPLENPSPLTNLYPSIIPSTITASPTQKIVADYKAYSSSKYKISFDFPSDWTVKEDQRDQYNFTSISIMKDGYSLDLSIGGAWGPDPCEFSDKKLPNSFVSGGIVMSDPYVGFATSTGVYRRSLSDDQSTTNSNVYTICYKENESDIFSEKLAIEGWGVYRTPKNPDLESLEILDNILQTLRNTD